MPPNAESDKKDESKIDQQGGLFDLSHEKPSTEPVEISGAPSSLPSALAAPGSLSSGHFRQKPTTWMSKWGYFAGLPILGIVIWGAILLLVGWIIYGFLFPVSKATVFNVTRQTIAAAVYGTVNIEPTTQAIVRTQNSGTILKIPVTKGDIVKTNQILAELSDPNIDMRVDQAKGNLTTAKNRMDIGPASRAQLEEARADVIKLKPLAEEGNIPRTEYDRAVSKQKTLEDQVKNEQLVLESEVRQAEQALQEATTASKQSFILAPQDGVVLDVYAQIGELVSSREQLFLVASRETQIRAQVNEEDVGMLKVGMLASVKLFSYRGQDFVAQVREILPKGVNMEYSVLLDLKKAPENLLPGMTGEINIITGKKNDALVIPTRAVFNGNRVWVVRNGRVSEQSIEIGFRNVGWTEVREGLKESEQVIVSGIDLFKVGQRVYTELDSSLQQRPPGS